MGRDVAARGLAVMLLGIAVLLAAAIWSTSTPAAIAGLVLAITGLALVFRAP